MIRKLISFLSPNKESSNPAYHETAPMTAPTLRAGPDQEIIVMPLAGTTFQGRGEWIRGLSLCSCLTLVPEPENSFDPRAVAVQNAAGNTLGYLPRSYAHPLFKPLMDKTIGTDCEIIRLEQDLQATTPSLHLAAVVPTGLLDLKPNRQLEFSCSQGSGGALYVMLNCDGALFGEIENGLTAAGMAVERKGPAHRIGGDGHVYEWYLRMAEDVSESMIKAWFLEVRQLQPYGTVLSEDVDAYAELFDAELASQQEKIDALKSGLDTALQENRSIQRQHQRELEEAQWRTLCRLLPNLTFVRDSRDVLMHEIAKPEHLYRDLLCMEIAPETVSSKRVRSTDSWLEFHFNTGHGNDGRCYYKRSGANVEVLVSFKTSQDKDIRWMQKND
jgi:hypothetical protein